MKDINNVSQPESRRIQSVKQKVRSYQQQQLAIKIDLNSVDKKCNRKVIFEEDSESSELVSVVNTEHDTRKSLFESDSEGEDLYNFESNTHLNVENNRKLLERQIRYKGDKRFTLDDRFIDDQTVESDAPAKSVKETSLVEEKKTEMDILREVLGVEHHPNLKDTELRNKKNMLRFDPGQPDHLKFQSTIPLKKDKAESSDYKDSAENNAQQLNVSKDVFYKVNDDLKNVFQEEKKFSLLNLFGQTDAKEYIDTPAGQKDLPTRKFPLQNNPFRYDSSEDELDNFKDSSEVVEESSSLQKREAILWSLQFFFRDDDFRLQEGADFVRRISPEQKFVFEGQRKKLKYIIKSKVRNIQKKKNPFKKKLGGNKKKKMLRMKKAAMK